LQKLNSWIEEFLCMVQKEGKCISNESFIRVFDKIQILLLGNKSDNNSEYAITKEEIDDWCIE